MLCVIGIWYKPANNQTIFGDFPEVMTKNSHADTLGKGARYDFESLGV